MQHEQEISFVFLNGELDTLMCSVWEHDGRMSGRKIAIFAFIQGMTTAKKFHIRSLAWPHSLAGGLSWTTPRYCTVSFQMDETTKSTPHTVWKPLK